MTNARSIFLFVLTGVVSVAPGAFALDPSRPLEQYTLRRWTLDDGLPQGTVTSIVQDDDGYLWIGTFGGLARFDGTRVDVIDSRGSCSRRILALESAPDGTLWVGTERSGLCRLRDGVLSEVDIPGVGGVAEIESTAAGGVRAATAHGVLEIDATGVSRFTVADGLPHENSLAVARHPDGPVWVGTREGLCLLTDGRCRVPEWSAPFDGMMVDAIHHSAFGASWVGTERGLYWVRDGEVERTFADANGAAVRVIIEDRNGGLWVGLDAGGLRRILPRVESLTGIDRHTMDTVRAIFEDREGNLWIGSAGDGIVQLTQGAAVGVRVVRDGEPLPVLPVVAEGNGRAWVGTACGGVARIDRGRETRFFGRSEGLEEPCVWSLLPDGGGGLWVGTYGDGLHRMDADGRFRSLGGPSTPEGLVRALAEDRDGSLLVGTDEGVFRFDPRTERFDRIEGTAELDVFFVDLDPIGSGVWIGALQGAWRLGEEGLERFGAKLGLSAPAVRAIHRDARGVVWIGSYGEGLSRVEGDGVFTFGPEHGLPDAAVSRILEDGQGVFWTSGNRGVTRVRRRELDAVARGELQSVDANLFDASDGMPATETNGGGQPAGALAPDGEVWFPTVGGLAIFPTERENLNLVPPQVHIEKVQVDGREIDLGDRVVLDPEARNLEIHYTGLSFTAPEKVRFRYRLLGFDDRWIDAGTRRVAYYPVIPPGELRFRVVATNDDGVSSEVGATFAFRMRPRFVDTRAFYGLCALLVSVVFLLALRVRTAAGARRERELEREVEKRTGEIERLRKLTEVINEAVRPEEVLDRLYDDLREIVPYDRIGLALVDEERRVVRAVWSRSEAEDGGIDPGYEASLGETSLLEVLEEDRPRIIGDLEAYAVEHPESVSTEKILRAGIHSNLTFPLRSTEGPVGFVFLSSREVGTYDETHVELLEQISGHLSLIVEKSRLVDGLERANRELERLAAVDGLTGLANRRSFDERLEVEWNRALRSGSPLGLLMIDVDFFKAYNDEYGHGEGDRALRDVAGILARRVRRAGDLAARYGGEEFAVILSDSDRVAASGVAYGIRAAVEALDRPHERSEVAGVVTVSIGVAVGHPTPASDPASLLERADAALYEAKDGGRNRVVVRPGEPGVK